MLPEPPPTLKGEEARAFLEDVAKPPSPTQIEFAKDALKRFPK